MSQMVRRYLRTADHRPTDPPTHLSDTTARHTTTLRCQASQRPADRIPGTTQRKSMPPRLEFAPIAKYARRAPAPLTGTPHPRLPERAPPFDETSTYARAKAQITRIDTRSNKTKIAKTAQNFTFITKKVNTGCEFDNLNSLLY